METGSEQQFTPDDASRKSSFRPSPVMWVVAGVVVLVVAILIALLINASSGVRSDLSARDQELCGIALDDDQSIGYLSTQVDELISNDGQFSSEGDAFAFQQVPVGRSINELDSRIANFDQPDSAGFIDDPELLASAKTLRDVLFDVQVAADQGNSIDPGTLQNLRGAIDGLVETCT